MTILQVEAKRIDDTLGFLQHEALLQNLDNIQQCGKQDTLQKSVRS